MKKGRPKNINDVLDEQESQNNDDLNVALNSLNRTLGRPLAVENFIPSGSTDLDIKLGGGYALGRMVHVVGDSSSGKSQLAIEATANFARKFPTGKIFYCDAEAAFDPGYAEVLGMPLDRVQFVHPTDPEKGITVEDMDRQVSGFVDSLKSDEPGLFILDSLDALPNDKEVETLLADQSGYGGGKRAGGLSDFFRRSIQRLAYKSVCFFIISQTRDNIEGYGPKKKFSGGNAPKFYASQRLILKQVELLKKVQNKIEIPVGVRVRAKVDKNKCGRGYQEVDYDIIFNYGIDDMQSILKNLKDIDKLSILPEEYTRTDKGISSDWKVPYNRIEGMERPERKIARQAVKDAYIKFWETFEAEVQDKLPSGKYDD
jgi:recombination protein RecA